MRLNRIDFSVQLCGFVAVLCTVCLCFGIRVRAQQPAAGSDSTNLSDSANSAGGTPEERLAALHLEMTNAYNRVLAIVNRPVVAYRRTQNMRVSTYSPGWFHEGAGKPDFNTVDVRQTQDLHYGKDQYVTSDLNPGLVFLGQDLEFNSMTKYFYTNRTLPKHKLSEPEMLEINRLYRILGSCERDIFHLETRQEQVEAKAAKAADEGEAGSVIPGQSFEKIRSIPKESRMLYGGIGIGVLVVLMVALRLFRR
jgi:hypothetical protein